ncbi:PREDICTED: uncharacterized protein LOC105452650 [Wasmannia auropunctata]|uniref:uncharacterized protein LOC105452650 n=1 Tax=Wasmannia auropunctata TaxID=64793 RepID=UPI0005EE9CFA|nr:PREDICTED: uncharacterized protein LOC105452650 [Wasmannia auropunctata]
MDLVYIPEVFTYGYSRNPQYRDYEQPWNRDYFKCGSSSRKSVENQRAVQQQSKENCHLCKEMKRRNLAVYIRSKSRSDSCHEGINEEEEENDAMYNERKAGDAERNKSAKSSRGAEKS